MSASAPAPLVARRTPPRSGAMCVYTVCDVCVCLCVCVCVCAAASVLLLALPPGELTPPREHSCLSDEDKVQGGAAQTKDRGTSTDAPCRRGHASSSATATRSKLQERPPAPPPPHNYTPAPLYPAGKADGGGHHRERIRYHTDVRLEPTEEIYLTPVQRSADVQDRPFLSQQTEQGRMSISSDTEGPPPYQPLPDRTNPSIYEEDEVYIPPPSYASCVEALITPPRSSAALDLGVKGAGTGAGATLGAGSSVEYVDDDSYCGEDEDVDRMIRMGGAKAGAGRTSMSSEASGLSYDSVKYTLVVDEHAQLELVSLRQCYQGYSDDSDSATVYDNCVSSPYESAIGEEYEDEEEDGARLGGVRREATACLSEDSTPEADLHFSKKFLNVFMNGRSRSSSKSAPTRPLNVGSACSRSIGPAKSPADDVLSPLSHT